MRVPLQWLVDYVDVDLDVDELAHRLTMTGLKVESIERLGADWGDVVIGEVVAIEPHPHSRKPLHVTRVNVGDGEIRVVTGAQNVRLGDRAPIVRVGGTLPVGPDGEPMTIDARPMAGIISEGMLASARELGISDEHEGILILPPSAPVGSPLRSFLGGDVLDIETNPNRPDTLSMVGIAREIAAITQHPMTALGIDMSSSNVEWLDDDSIAIEVEAPDLCPRYSALRVEGVSVRPSPFWLKTRLEAAGMRSINTVVDITNYVMLELGQPLHAFDVTDIVGERMVVRRAGPGEVLRTLDGVDRILTEEDLVIADSTRPVGIAGVMGGENSEVRESTQALVLESATFDGVSVRKTAQSLGLRTEASSRFEKGLPAETTIPALQRCLQLLAQVSEGPLKAARMSDVWVGPQPEKRVVMPTRDLHRLLGVEIAPDTASKYLRLLGFDVSVQDEALQVVVPYWRRTDINRSADVVEEVARLAGFESIPTTLPRRTMEPSEPVLGLAWEETFRERLLAAGLSEATTHSLTSPESMARLFAAQAGPPGGEGHLWESIVPNPDGVRAHGAIFEPVALLNPATRDRRVLRLSIIPALLDVVARNLKNAAESVAVFEMERAFFARETDDLPYERRTLSLALAGRRQPLSWQDRTPGPFTLFDLKGILECLVHEVHPLACEVQPASHPALHPGRSAMLSLNGTPVAYFGEVHPLVAEAFEIEGSRIQVAEIDLEAVVEAARGRPPFRSLPRFPSARRDLAVVVPKEATAADIMRVVRGEGGVLLQAADIFDVYEGDPLPTDTKSVAIALEFRSDDATLTQEEVGETMERIASSLAQELRASLRE